ncbi:hypothetical protein QBC35DRAFT_481287, partial [Podospora australis]
FFFFFAYILSLCSSLYLPFFFEASALPQRLFYHSLFSFGPPFLFLTCYIYWNIPLALAVARSHTLKVDFVKTRDEDLALIFTHLIWKETHVH